MSLLKVYALLLALVIGSCKVDGQTTLIFRSIICKLPDGSLIPCSSIVATGTAARNTQGNVFSLDALPGGPSSPSTNLTDPDDGPVQCDVDDICSCQSIDVIDLDSVGAGLIECSGFIESESTEVEELANITAQSCNMSYTAVVDIKDNVTGIVRSENVTVCFGDAELVEESCPNNTGVVVIIIICCIVLLTILALTAYWIRHENNKYNGDNTEPKFSVDSVVQSKVT
eukprot:m.126569 g.126569  ORF g.126569 m.126569 type:complete len:228 (-) comp17378_c0_seq1:352-1035(-)